MESSSISSKKFIIGTRASDLAKVQTYEVIDWLIAAATAKGIELTKDNFEVHEITNSVGDVDLKNKLYNMKGVGVFWKELEIALLDKQCDIGVHSMKDLQTTETPGLIVSAIPGLKARDDIVILKSDLKHLGSIDNLPDGSIIGTSSLRRIWMLTKKYPNLKIENIRGNLNTRLKKLEEQDFSAIILARAGVERLGWGEKIDQILDKTIYQYAPAQGSLAVQWRTDDNDTQELLKLIDNPFSRRIVEAERIYLRTLEGGCSIPISVNSQVFHKDDLDTEITEFNKEWDTNDYILRLNGTVYDQNDHTKFLEHLVEGSLDNWIELGKELANELRDKGATEYVKLAKAQDEK